MNRACVALAAAIFGFSFGAAQSGPARISGGVMAGQNLTKVAPVYPAEARAAHVSGMVVLHAIIGRDGTIENLTVISGPEMLRASALDAVRQWTYKPYLLNGEPVEVDTTITVNFNLREDAPPPAMPPGDSAPSGMAASGTASASLAPVKISGGVMAGRILTRTTLVYPPLQPHAHVSGATILHAIIGKDGRIENLTVIAGPEILRAPILDNVRHWTYKPYLLNGEPVEVETTIMINHNFGDEAPSPVTAPSDSASQGR